MIYIYHINYHGRVTLTQSRSSDNTLEISTIIMIPHPIVIHTILLGLSFLSTTGQYYPVGAVSAEEAQKTFDHHDYPLGAAYEESNFSGRGTLLFPGCQDFAGGLKVSSYLILPGIEAKCWFHEVAGCPASDKGPAPLWVNDIHISHKTTQGNNQAKSAYCWRPELSAAHISFPVGVIYADPDYSGASETVAAETCNKFQNGDLIGKVSSYLLLPLPEDPAKCQFYADDDCPQIPPLWTAQGEKGKGKLEKRLSGDQDDKAKSARCTRVKV